jgi:hypothetical protein
VHVAWELSRLEERSRILAEEDALLGGAREPGARARSDEETG